MRQIRVAVALLLFAAGPAVADIYTWTDKNGVTNVSNLPPPEGARVLKVTRSAPRDPEREAAAREAARQAELRALDERLRQLTAELEQTRQPPPPVVVVAAPAPAYAPTMPSIINVVTQPAPPAMGCDYGWGDCGFGLWPGYYPVVYPGYSVNPWFGKGRYRGHRPTPYAYNSGQLIPPLIPPPPGHGPRMAQRSARAP